MLTLPSPLKIYIAPGATDMRKSIDGLAAMVSGQLKLKPTSTALFVFFNRQRDKVKILYWDRNGFALWYKKLAKGKFRPPQVRGSKATLSASDLSCILEGIDLLSTQRNVAV